MTLRLLISLSALFIAAQKISAQLAPAEDFFNGGAQLYISNNVPAALERVESGLTFYPEDEKLKKLEHLLKQQQQSQQQKQDQREKSEEQKNQQQKDSQSQKPDEQKQSQADQNKEDQPKPADRKKDSGDKPKDEKQKQQQAQPLKPGQMTPEEAKRLLDAQKGDEQLLQLKPQDKPRDSSRPVKDW